MVGLTSPSSLRQPPQDPESLRAERLERITALVARHDDELRRVVRRRGSRRPEVVDHACRYAWVQLLCADHVDLRPPLWEALAWLTSCAVRYARMLNEVERQVVPGEGAVSPVAYISAD